MSNNVDHPKHYNNGKKSVGVAFVDGNSKANYRDNSPSSQRSWSNHRSNSYTQETSKSLIKNPPSSNGYVRTLKNVNYDRYEPN